MRGGEVFRAVRRRRGWSQRELARAAGVAPRTVVAVESGRHAPSIAVLTAVLDAAGLELAVDLPAAGLDDRDVRFLRLSTTRRLALALGVQGRPSLPDGGRPAHAQLLSLVRHTRVTLHGDAARAVWLRPPQPLDLVEVCVDPRDGLPETPDLRLRTPCGQHVAVPVAVALSPWVVRVDPPAQLALLPEHAHERARLRAVARVLDVEAARDAGGRRARAHGEPDHWQDSESARWLTRTGPLPDPDDRRGWRLGGAASLRGWLDAAG